MDAIRVKARLNRKSRPSDGGRGAKAARPVHPAKGVAGRVPRVVKARAGRPPIPANDTIPMPAEEMGLPPLPEVEIEAVENATVAAAPAEGEEVVKGRPARPPLPLLTRLTDRTPRPTRRTKRRRRRKQRVR